MSGFCSRVMGEGTGEGTAIYRNWLGMAVGHRRAEYCKISICTPISVSDSKAKNRILQFKTVHEAACTSSMAATPIVQAAVTTVPTTTKITTSGIITIS